MKACPPFPRPFHALCVPRVPPHAANLCFPRSRSFARVCTCPVTRGHKASSCYLPPVEAEASKGGGGGGGSAEGELDEGGEPGETCSGRMGGAEREEDLRGEGMGPINVLASREGWDPVEFRAVMDFLSANRRYPEALEVFEWCKTQPDYKPEDQQYTYVIRMLGKWRRLDLVHHYFQEMEALGLEPSVRTLSSLLQGYAECGDFSRAEQVLTHMVRSGTKPNVVTYTGLIYAYGKHGLYDNMAKTFNNMKTVGCHPDGHTYCSLIRSYAAGGLFRRMEKTWREMDSHGWQPDKATINAIIQAYVEVGLVKELTKCYSLVREYRLLLNKGSVRAIALSFVRRSRFHQLKGFVKDLGLTRHDMGNLLWNLMFLSCSAVFQMRKLVLDFEAMEEAGFTPDLTSYNILVLSFSRMQKFWDLHVLALQMQSRGIIPDLVTFGAVVDAYVKRKLPSKKLYAALDELQVMDHSPEIRTDSLVMEAFGVGNFQQCCEALLESRKLRWTYGKLTTVYLKRLGEPPCFSVRSNVHEPLSA